jgi:RHS repeat-associated protein
MNRPSVCRQSWPGAANFAVSRYYYTKLGNLSYTTRDEEGGKGDYFTYEDINQAATALYSATGPSDSNPARSVTYALSVRNRTGMTVVDNILHTTTSTTYAPVDLNQYSSITVNGTAHSLSWDTNFNLKNYNGWAYAYDAENRLISVSGNGHSATFTYDAVGRCVKRVIDQGTPTVYTYDQWTPVAEWDGNGNIMAANVFGLGDDEILYRGTTSSQLLYKSDPMGNVKFILDISSNGIEKYTYDGFGQPQITDANGNTRTASAYGNRFMFSGREYFSELGLYDMRNRVYDPAMGRFYQTDPIGFQGDPLNLYRFCGNNPLLGGDPMGLQEDDSGLSFTLGGDWGISPDWSSSNVDVSSSWWGDSGNFSPIPWSAYESFSSTSTFLSSYFPSASSSLSLGSSGVRSWTQPRKFEIELLRALGTLYSITQGTGCFGNGMVTFYPASINVTWLFMTYWLQQGLSCL